MPRVPFPNLPGLPGQLRFWIERNFRALEEGGSHTHDGTGGNSTVVGGVAEVGAAVPDASGSRAVAIGDFAKATQLGTVSIGGGTGTATNTQATASQAVAVGMGAAATGNFAIAIGSGASASGPDNVAVGASTVTHVNGSSTAVGSGASANGEQATAVGRSAAATALNATAIGRAANAGHSGATAIGAGVTTGKANQTKVGGVFLTAGARELTVAKLTVATLALGETHDVIVADATAAAITITLPSATAGASGTVGRIYRIKKIDASANTVTISRSGTDTIDGAATRVLSAQWASVTLIATEAGKWSVFG